LTKSTITIKTRTNYYCSFCYPYSKSKNADEYKSSPLYAILACGKDVFYRLLNNEDLNWHSLHYSISKKLIKQSETKTDLSLELEKSPKCLIVDDTDLPKTSRFIELIARIYFHDEYTRYFRFQTAFYGSYQDGKSLFALDDSLHGELGKKQEKTFGVSIAQRKKKYKEANKKQLRQAMYGRIYDFQNPTNNRNDSQGYQLRNTL
jgi:hypothetical protein